MNRILTALMLSTALMAPAFAEDMAKDLSCKDFLAMSHDDQMSAMAGDDAMATDAMAGDDAMATDGAMAEGDAMATDGAMAEGDAMAADGAMAEGDAMAADGAMAEGDAMATDDAMAAMVKTCTENPDMMAMDAMHAMN